MYRLENYSPLLRNMHFRTLPYNIIEENHYYVPNPTKNFMCILPGHLMNLLHVKNIEKMANMLVDIGTTLICLLYSTQIQVIIFRKLLSGDRQLVSLYGLAQYSPLESAISIENYKMDLPTFRKKLQFLKLVSYRSTNYGICKENEFPSFLFSF